MIIHSIKAANWKCLKSVDIRNLSPKINVIYAPNKTGKSTLADAIRVSVDYKHDISEGKIKRYIPWHSEAIPEIELEFQVKNRRYRLLKKFSRTKNGKAELYLLQSGSGDLKICEGDQVTDEIRKIIGLDNSSTGIANLLWVRQGTVDLPRMDAQLENSLRTFLGGIQETPADKTFRDLLINKLSAWINPGPIKNKTLLSDYSPASGRVQLNDKDVKKGSDLADIKKTIENCKVEASKLESRRMEIEKRVLDMQKNKAEIYEVEANLKSKGVEIGNLSDLDKSLDEKKKKAQQLEYEIKEANKDIQMRLEEKERIVKAGKELQSLEKSHSIKLEELSPFRDKRDLLEGKRRDSKARLATLENDYDQLQVEKHELEVKKNILDLMGKITELNKISGQVAKIEKSISGYRSELNSLLAPERKTLNKITALISERDKIEAQLNASRLKLSINPEKPFMAELQIDHRQKRSMEFTTDGKFEEPFNQRASITIAKLGTIEVKRGEENENIEGLEKKNKENIQNLLEFLAPLGIKNDLSGPEIITELQARVLRSSELNKDIVKNNEELNDLVPEGNNALGDQIQKFEAEKKNLIDSFPRLKKWAQGVSVSDLKDNKNKCDKAIQSIDEELSTAKNKVKQTRNDIDGLQSELDAAETTVKQISEELVEINAKLKAKEDELSGYKAKHGLLENIEKAITKCEKELSQKEEEYGKYKLTEEEKSIPEKLEQARNAERNLLNSLGNLRGEQGGLDNELSRDADLDQRMTEARQILDENEKRLHQLEIIVESHCLICRLYDEIKDLGVEKTLRPVSDQIDIWLKEMDGVNSKKVFFGDGFNPEAIDIGGGRSEEIEESTSYGELEQLSTIIRLAYGTILAKDDPQVVILDDPLAHSDSFYHDKMAKIIEDAARKNLQVIILTCRQERFAELRDANFLDLKSNLNSQ